MTNEFDIIDHPLVFMWLRDYVKHEPLGVTFLTQGNSIFFQKKWGNPDGKTQKYNYWKKDYLGITLYVYSDLYETYYKVQYLGEKDMFIQDKKMGTYLTGFLSKLTKDILNN
jgi:hypothetical protein